MIKTTKILLDKLKEYENPYSKIRQLERNHEIFPIIKGLYETNNTVNGYYLAQAIYGPSYLSFDFALAYYSLIPKAVYTFTSATFNKKKRKIYSTSFGNYTYQDVPKKCFKYGIKIIRDNEYTFSIASPEKALCDKLYSLKPLKTKKKNKTMFINN